MSKQTLRDLTVIGSLAALLIGAVVFRQRLAVAKPEHLQIFYGVVGAVMVLGVVLGFVAAPGDAGRASTSVLRRAVLSARESWKGTALFSAACVGVLAVLVLMMPIRRTVATNSELNVLNEWVAVIASSPSEGAAQREAAAFNASYEKLGHRNDAGEPIWHPGTIHVVRDIDNDGMYLVVIDMYPGPSSMECVQSGISELRSTLAARSSDADGRVMSDYLKENLKGEPKCYDLTEFESAYGTIQDNPATREKRGFGSCHERVKRATPDVHCEYD